MTTTSTSSRRIPEFLTEALGTFLVVAIGTSALTAINLAGQATTPLVILVTSLAFSIPLAWLTYHFSHHRLAQFNPATTLLLLLNQKLSLIPALINMLAQLAAALLASIAVGLLYGNPGVEIGLGAPQALASAGDMTILIVEFMGSLVVFCTILYHLHQSNSLAKLSLNLGLAALAMSFLATGISGASFNPFRSLAPQLASGQFNATWAYVLAPFVAAIIATIISQTVRVQKLAALTHQDKEQGTEDSHLIITDEAAAEKPQDIEEPQPINLVEPEPQLSETSEPKSINRPKLSFSNFNINPTQTIASTNPEPPLDNHPSIIQPTIVQPDPQVKPTTKTKLSFIDYDQEDSQS